MAGLIQVAAIVMVMFDADHSLRIPHKLGQVLPEPAVCDVGKHKVLNLGGASHIIVVLQGWVLVAVRVDPRIRGFFVTGMNWSWWKERHAADPVPASSLK